MRVVVLGHQGMLGSDVMEAFQAAGAKVLGYDVDELDITDASQVLSGLPSADWVINCAAYTRVDDAQVEREKAYSINVEGARNVAKVCHKKNIKSVYISTDYVFDGFRNNPYTEKDITNPLSIYGASKLAGEKAVRAEGGHYIIVRTQSLFGARGLNFVKSILKKLDDDPGGLKVVDDQVSAPTYTRHLADGLLRLIIKNAQGIVHVSASRECSWHTFAKAIADRVLPGTEVGVLKTAELNLPAPRPAFSVLDTQKYRKITGHIMPTWETGLDEYLKEEGRVS